MPDRRVKGRPFGGDSTPTLDIVETSTTQAIKIVITTVTGLSRDALHIYVGLAVLIVAAIVLRKHLSSAVPWVIVLAVATLGELLDMRDDIAGIGYWRWAESLHDVLNTMAWPTVLMVLARFGSVFNASDRRGV
jgi:hypothetical protein